MVFMSIYAQKQDLSFYFCKNDFQCVKIDISKSWNFVCSPKSMHKYNLIMHTYIAISQSMLSLLSNIHDHAYAHITTRINMSQEFKHINHRDMSISKSCITQNQSRK